MYKAPPKKIILFLTLIVSFHSYAAVNDKSQTDSGVIKTLMSYSDYGQGDVLVYFDTGLDECPSGLYIPPKMMSFDSNGIISETVNPGASNNLSLILAAHMANRKVRFEVYSERIWKGSLTPRCEIRRVDLFSN